MMKLLAIFLLTALASADDGFTFELDLYKDSNCNTIPESANITSGVCNTANTDSNDNLNFIITGNCSHMSATLYVNNPSCSGGVSIALPVSTNNGVCNSDLNETLNFKVTDCHENSSSSGGDLSTGEVVGIVIGVFVLLFALNEIRQ